MIVGLDGQPLKSEPRPEPNAVPVDSFIWEREVPEGWQERLDQLFPRDQGISFLVIGWVAGTPDSAIQRWIIYEAMPEVACAPAVKEALHYMATQERASDHTAEERRILQYWTEHHAHLRPFWVVQGEHGGHKYRFDKAEARMLRLMDMPDEPPLPGDLPYAPFDERVAEQLQRWDLLRKGYADLRAGALAEKKRAEQEWRRGFLTWLHRQLTLENVYRDVDFESGLPRTAEHDPMSEDRLGAVEEHYIRTGQLLPVRSLPH